MQELQKQHGTAIIMITHDLGVVADMADRILVMYAGKPVEYGSSQEIFYQPLHPYTWGLMRSIPKHSDGQRQPLTPIKGNPPSLINLSDGCAFSERCPYVQPLCEQERPEMAGRDGSSHKSACHFSTNPEFLKNAPGYDAERTGVAQ